MLLVFFLLACLFAIVPDINGKEDISLQGLFRGDAESHKHEIMVDSNDLARVSATNEGNGQVSPEIYALHDMYIGENIGSSSPISNNVVASKSDENIRKIKTNDNIDDDNLGSRFYRSLFARLRSKSLKMLPTHYKMRAKERKQPARFIKQERVGIWG